jgi:hypothetical protein
MRFYLLEVDGVALLGKIKEKVVNHEEGLVFVFMKCGRAAGGFLDEI